MWRRRGQFPLDSDCCPLVRLPHTWNKLKTKRLLSFGSAPDIFEEKLLGSARIGLGSNDLVQFYDQKKTVEIEKWFQHPAYNISKAGVNDIALIKLKEPLKFNSTVQPACLATKFQESYDGPLKVNSPSLISEPHRSHMSEKLWTWYRRLVGVLWTSWYSTKIRIRIRRFG